MHPSSQQAMAILRDPALFRWYIVPFIAFVVYVYAVEIEKKNWNTISAGLSLFLVCWFSEIVNSVILHLTGYSAVWTSTGGTAFQLMVGVNIEIAFTFATAGVIFTKMLPQNKQRRIIGLPNRLFFALLFAVILAGVEILLSRTPYFVWNYTWWGFPHIWLVLAAYSFGIGLSFYVHDLTDTRKKLRIVLGLLLVDLAGTVFLSAAAGWI